MSEGAAGYEMKVTGVFGGDATKRQVAEAVCIQHARGGANQQTGRVAAGQTAAHRAQPVLRSTAGHQLVSRDVTTGARRKRMGPGAQRNNKQFVKGRTGRNVTQSE